MKLHTGTSRPEATGSLVALTPEECWELVRSEPVGRLAWNEPQGPMIIPVNFAVTDGGIRVLLSVHSAAARRSVDSVFAFQVDRIAPDTRTGWSVLTHGQADFDWNYGRVDASGVDVWPDGGRPLCLHLEVFDISGRRITS